MVMVLVPSPLSQEGKKEGNGVVVAAAVEETFQKQHYCCYNPRRTDLIGFGLIKLYCTLWYPRRRTRESLTTEFSPTTGVLDNHSLVYERSCEARCWKNPVMSLMSTDYRGENKDLFVLLSNSQAGQGRTVKQEHEEISRNHEQTFIFPSVM